MKAKSVEIMQDKGPWKFTEEQIRQIKDEDVIAITKFYHDNYQIIEGMAKQFVRRRKRMGDYAYLLEDLLQQVYVDIPHYHYSSRARLYLDIVKGSFSRCYEGGVLRSQDKFVSEEKLLSIDAPSNNGSDSSYLINYLTEDDPFQMLEDIEEREQKDNQIIDFLEKTITNKKDLNKMFCQIFTDMPLTQIKGDEYERYKQCKSQDL